MKRSNVKIIIIIFSLFFSAGLMAQGIDVGFHVGLSTPNDKISDIYNKSTVNLSDTSAGSLLGKGLDAGYHLAVKGRIGLSDNADFIVGFGIHRFPETDIEVRDPSNPDVLLATLSSNTNIIPITAGLNYYLINSFIGIYATGDLTYNYITTSVDYKGTGIDIPISKTPTDNRMGFGVGAGLDISLGLIMLNVEGKYNYLNLIGKEEEEGNKAYFTLGVGVYF